jgi:hypothetical protein
MFQTQLLARRLATKATNMKKLAIDAPGVSLKGKRVVGCARVRLRAQALLLALCWLARGHGCCRAPFSH